MHLPATTRYGQEGQARTCQPQASSVVDRRDCKHGQGRAGQSYAGQVTTVRDRHATGIVPRFLSVLCCAVGVYSLIYTRCLATQLCACSTLSRSLLYQSLRMSASGQVKITVSSPRTEPTRIDVRLYQETRRTVTLR